MKHKRLIIHGGLAGLLMGGIFGLAWDSREYTSTAVLRLVPSTLPDKLVPAQTRIHLETRMPAMMQVILSRANLESLIDKYKLYSGERSRMPMADVIEQMRKAIRATSKSANSFEVSFSYPDGEVAHKVAADLVSRIVTEFSRERIVMAKMNLHFLTDSAQNAGIAWEESLAKVRSAKSAGKPLDRVELDRQIAQQRYQSLRERVAEAEMLVELERRQQAQNLEILDPPSLPVDSRPSVILSTVLGCVVGALLGLLISMAFASRSRDIVTKAV